jgi:DHA1 family tetracycline resistance protein-like MFS transporter
MLSKAAGARQQGAVQGFASSAGAVASIVGLVAGGILYASLGARVFWVSSVIILNVFFVSLWLSSPPRRAVAA